MCCQMWPWLGHGVRAAAVVAGVFHTYALLVDSSACKCWRMANLAWEIQYSPRMRHAPMVH